MPLPPVDLTALLDTVTFTGWKGLRIGVWAMYGHLTEAGWKVDTEESNLMVAMSRTWRAEGIKVWIHLGRFVCAPPEDDVEVLDTVTFYRFDPATMPAETMEEKMYDPGDALEDWYDGHRQDWAWLVDHGDPQSDTHALLTAVPMREVPEDVLLDAWGDLETAVGAAVEALEERL